MTRIYLKDNELKTLKAVCNMLEENISNDDKTMITASALAKNLGVSYNTVRKNIKKLKDL